MSALSAMTGRQLQDDATRSAIAVSDRLNEFMHIQAQIFSILQTVSPKNARNYIREKSPRVLALSREIAALFEHIGDLTEESIARNERAGGDA